MNFFRSDEHARNWAQFDAAFVQNLQPLAVWAKRFSAERYRARVRPGYISWFKAQQRAQSIPPRPS